VAIGGSGGPKIFPSVFQVLLSLDWGLDIRDAIEFGRLLDQLYPPVLVVEHIYPENILDDLRQRGHNVSGTVLISISFSCVLSYFLPAVLDINRSIGVVQAVLQMDSDIYGES